MSYITLASLVLLVVGMPFVFAMEESEGWDDFANQEPQDLPETSSSGKDPSGQIIDEDFPTYREEELIDAGVGKRYTQEFYIALGVGAVGLLLIAFLIKSLLVSPKNRWQKKKLLKKK